MKRKLPILLLIVVLLASACTVQGNATPTVEEDQAATMVAMKVELTLQAGKIAELEETLSQPTATMPPTSTFDISQCPTCPPPAGDSTATVPPSPTPRPEGSISGQLIYPSEVVPAQRVVAFNTITGEYYWVNTVQGQTTYSISSLPEATYHVLAYSIENPSQTFYAAYSEFVACGLEASCASHALIDVEVKGGQQTTGVDPIDWYATDPLGLGWPLDPTINWP